LFWWAKLSPRWWKFLVVVAFVGAFFLIGTNAASRYRVLYFGIALITSYYLFIDRPFRFRDVLFLISVASAYVIGVGFLRRGPQTDREVAFSDLSRFDLGEAVDRFFSSEGDLGIFDAFLRLVTVIPRDYPYLFPGRTLAELLVHFVPRAIWEGKPLTTEVLVNYYMIGDYGVLKAQGGNWVYSLPGSFYVEGGALAILVGTILFGVFCRTVWNYYLIHNDVGAKMLLAVTLPSILFHQRDGFTANNTFWYLIYLVPVLVGLYLSATKSQDSKKGAGR